MSSQKHHTAAAASSRSWKLAAAYRSAGVVGNPARDHPAVRIWPTARYIE
jgi:hypothetical protein